MIDVLPNKIVLAIFLFFCANGWGGQLLNDQKIKGISFVASPGPISKDDVQPIVEINANWVTLMPYGYIDEDGKLKFNSNWQWWGEKEEGLKKTIELCHAAHLKIMLKPQIWLMSAYTGDFFCSNEDDWRKFELSYRDFILTFLNIAVESKVEMFCVGTEWREFVKARKPFWNKLISEVKQQYKGELTYAANWDDFQAVPFWNDMDYIGVNGYFPISYSANPKLEELKMGWEIHKKTLEDFSKKHNAPILFTEIGYRSMIGSTTKPWDHQSQNKFSAEIQDKAYQALFHVLWKEPWFKGIFIWKWFHGHKKQGGNQDLDFTPQNKLAAKTIQQFWSN